MYKIIYTSLTVKALQKMPRNTANLIREKIGQIANDPYAPNPNALKLQGREGYRLRIGDWRVIYEINKEEIVILVLKIAPRGEVYK